MNKYVVKINTPNKIILVRGIPTRTPVEMVISEKEIEPLKVNLNFLGATDYSIKEYVPPSIEEKLNLDEIPEDIYEEETVIEEVFPDSTIGKLLKGDLNIERDDNEDG